MKTPTRAKETEADVTWRFGMCHGTDAAKDARPSTGCGGVFGLRGSVADLSGGVATRRTGLEASVDSEEYRQRGIMSALWQYRLAIGGGGAGLEGTLLGGGAFGFRVPVTEHQGPVIRAGAQGYVLGDDAFYASLLELPQLQLGWQWTHGHAVVEVAATSGAVLTGKFRPLDAQTRETGAGFAYGGHVSLQVPWVRLSAMAERLPSGDGLDAVDMAMGTLCAVASPMAICADARVEQAHARVAGGEPFVRAAYAGLTIGITGEH